MTQKKAKAADMLDGGAKDEASLILDYLRKQNRPYSAIDVSTNLHNKVTKSQYGRLTAGESSGGFWLMSVL